MSFYRSPAVHFSDLLQEAAARSGFSASEMQQLLECELNVDHLLAYISAVAANRMN